VSGRAGYFVDGVVLAYDTPPPPNDEDLADDMAADELHAADDHAAEDHGAEEEPVGASTRDECDGADGIAGFPTRRGYRKASLSSKGGVGGGSHGSLRTRCRDAMRRKWRRVSPALSVLTFVVSIDNFVSGLGVMPKLDTTAVPAVACARLPARYS
jgi:hypothetical protein